ncbi:MAG TPA: NAD(P)/FAD-dependent oxidoreductase [Candidatus Limnocylindria bacterium]|nr:NAD(P)/FAD-dependent oxidoreductase [Candidatus Limnocylindria bacterium]
MTNPAVDVVVIGGGPGGSCAATKLARAGKRVLLLEKEHFPRFHIGESLLPYNNPIFEEIGVMPELQAAGFPRKVGAQFFLGNGSKSLFFVFRNGKFTKHTESFQVERAKFDHILLRHAAKSGADVREGVSVTNVAADANGVTVSAQDENGGTFTARAQYVIDASGRGNVTGNLEGIKVVNPRYKKMAIFGHFEGVMLDSGTKANDTIIIRLANKWFWMIPLRVDADPAKHKVSIGLVMDRDEIVASKKTPEVLFHEIAKANIAIAERIQDAKLVSPIQVTSDFSYRNRSFWSPRVVRVGDATGFLDPIFSSGVYLAMFSAKWAAQDVLKLLDTGNDGSRRFARYEKHIHSAMQLYWEMVENFYTTPFMEIFMEPRPKWDIAAAVNAVLAGELEGGWRLKWRMRAFFWLIKFQARRPFMPKISFEPIPTVQA